MTYIVRNIFWTYLFSYLSIPLGYLLRVLYSQNLSVYDYGIIYAIMGLFALISVFNDLGFSEALNYLATKFYEKKDYTKFKSVFALAVIMQTSTAAVLSVLMFFLAPLLSQYYFQSDVTQLFRLFIPYFFFMNVAKPFLVLPTAKQKPFISVFSEPLRISIVAIASLGIFAYSFQYVIPLAWALSFAILLVVYAIISYKIFRDTLHARIKITKHLFGQTLKYAWPIMLGIGASLILGKIDIQIILLYLGAESAAYYINALALATMILLLAGPMASVLFPLTTKLIENKNYERLKDVISQIVQWISIISLPVLISVFFFGKDILGYVFGPDYVKGASALSVLGIAMFVYGYCSFNLSILGGLGKPSVRTMILYITATINIVLDIVLVPLVGIVGAAIGTLVSFVFLLIASIVLISKDIKMRYITPALYKIFGANLIIALTFWLLTHVYLGPLVMEVLLSIAIAGVLYLAALFWSGALSTSEVKRIIAMVKNEKK